MKTKRIKITRRSTLTGQINTLLLPVTQEQLNRYESGNMLLQDVFPHLSAPEREFIKSGITPREWKKYFAI